MEELKTMDEFEMAKDDIFKEVINGKQSNLPDAEKQLAKYPNAVLSSNYN